MEDLLNLILRFKEYNGSAVVNFKVLESHYNDETSKLDLTSAFDYMACQLNNICTRLTNTTAFGTLANELFQAIAKVDQIISLPEDQTVDLKSFLALIENIRTKCIELHKEILNPSLLIVKIGDRNKRITFLPRIPLSVFFRAVTELKASEMNQNSLKASSLRKVALLSLAGGVCHNLLEKRELLGFRFLPEYFEQLNLEFNLSSNGQFDDIFSQAAVILNRYTHNFYLHQNEATLRSFLWDQVLSVFITEVITAERTVASEFYATKLLNIDSAKIVDMAILTNHVYSSRASTLLKSELPVFFVEIGSTPINFSLRHKDFAKICGLMIASCARQAEKLQSIGRDPMESRSFGILIGGSRFQLLIAHPVVDAHVGNNNECYVSITSKETWLFDLLKPLGSTAGQTFLPQGETRLIPVNEADSKKLKKNLITSFDPKQFENLNLEENIEDELTLITDNMNQAQTNDSASNTNSVDPVTAPAPAPAPVNPDFSDPNSEKCELNRASLENLAIFFGHFNAYLNKMQSAPTTRYSPGDPERKVRFQKDSYVATSHETTTGVTPGTKRLSTDVLAGTRTYEPPESPSTRPRRAMIRKPLNYEYELYTKNFLNNAFFPLLYGSTMIDSDCDLDGKAVVEYTFEYMEPLLDSGVFSLFGGGKAFSSIVRADSFHNLLLEATTFALHTLYGLFQLHEQLQVVHCDISPENVMFSHMDDCWKLNDFGASLKLEDSLNSPRRVGTDNFIAPESLKTGIFTKESDIYSLGSVLFMTFNLRLMFFLEIGESDDEESRRLERSRTPQEINDQDFQINADYNEFITLVQKMVKNRPELRPCALEALRDFFNFFEKIQTKEFSVYGSQKIIPLIRELRNNYKMKTSEPKIITDEVPFTSIK